MAYLRIQQFPDDLFKDLKVQALVEETSVKQIVVQALRNRPRTVRVKVQALQPSDKEGGK